MKTYCPICHSSKTENLLNWKEYKISRCLEDDLLFTHPLPSDQKLNQFYQGFPLTTPEKIIVKKIKSKEKELLKLFELRSDHKIKEKKFLDYGGGDGIATVVAKNLGLCAYYFDIDENAKKYVKKKFKIHDHFIKNTLEEIKNIKFDYIFSDNVIEHVKFPIEFIKKLYNQLEKGGILVIKTPNASNTEIYFYPLTCVSYFSRSLKYNKVVTAGKAFQKRFWHCDPPRHLYSFSEKNLKTMMQILNIETYSIDYYNRSLISNTFLHMFLFYKIKNGKRVRGLIFRFIISPFVLIEFFISLFHIIFRSLKLISPGGLILTIEKC